MLNEHFRTFSSLLWSFLKAIISMIEMETLSCLALPIKFCNSKTHMLIIPKLPRVFPSLLTDFKSLATVLVTF